MDLLALRCNPISLTLGLLPFRGIVLSVRKKLVFLAKIGTVSRGSGPSYGLRSVRRAGFCSGSRRGLDGMYTSGPSNSTFSMRILSTNLVAILYEKIRTA